jgi:hypothetical protein
MTTLLLGFLGGFVAWLATTFVVSPITALLAARTEAAHALALSEHLDSYDPERDMPSSDVAEERTRSLAAAGAKLIAFEQANQYARPILKRLRIFPQTAWNALILLSQMPPYGVRNEDQRDVIMGQLRLGRKIAAHYRV